MGEGVTVGVAGVPVGCGVAVLFEGLAVTVGAELVAVPDG